MADLLYTLRITYVTGQCPAYIRVKSTLQQTFLNLSSLFMVWRGKTTQICTYRQMRSVLFKAGSWAFITLEHSRLNCNSWLDMMRQWFHISHITMHVAEVIRVQCRCMCAVLCRCLYRVQCTCTVWVHVHCTEYMRVGSCNFLNNNYFAQVLHGGTARALESVLWTPTPLSCSHFELPC